MGANVIAAVGSQAKLDICKKYGGADYGVDYTIKGWQKEVLKITDGRGVDVVYDPVGLIAGWLVYAIHKMFLIIPSIDSLKCIAWKGRALVVGFAAGKIEKVTDPIVLHDVKYSLYHFQKAALKFSLTEEYIYRRSSLGSVLLCVFLAVRYRSPIDCCYIPQPKSPPIFLPYGMHFSSKFELCVDT